MGSVAQATKGYLSGIHVPSLTWFKNNDAQDVDWDLQRKHLEFVIGAGLEGGTSRCLD